MPNVYFTQQSVIEVFDNVLELTNANGWEQLQEVCMM